MRIITIIVIMLFCFTCISFGADKSVKGYTKKNGTYVAPYKRSAPDSSKHNNYSTKGNTNPYNGKKGTADPYKKKSKSKSR